MIRFFSLILILPFSVLAESEPASVSAGGVVGVSEVMKVIFSLFVILMVIVAVAWIARNYLNSKSIAGTGVRIVGGVSLGGKDKILIVEAGGEQLLIGASQGRIAKLHVLERKIESNSVGKGQGLFGTHLKNMLGKKETEEDV